MRAGMVAVWLGLLVGVAGADDKAMDDEKYVQTQLDAKLPDFERRATLPAGLKYLGDLGQVNVYLQEDALAAAGYDLAKTQVAMSSKGASLRDCLNRTVKAYETAKTPLRWAVHSGVVVVSTANDKNWAALPEAANRSGQAEAFRDDTVIAEVGLDDTRFEEAVKILRDHGLNLHIHWQALAGLNIDQHNKVILKLTKVRPRTAMQLLVRRLAGPGGGVSFVVHDGVWVISTPKELAAQQKLWAQRPYNVEDQESANKLATVLDDAKLAKPLGQALEDLATMSDTKLEADWKSLKEAGIDQETPVNIAARQVRLSTALDLILMDAMAEKALDYTAKDSTVHIAMKKDPDPPATKPATRPATTRTVVKTKAQ